MFQPRAKMEFVRRYLPASGGWQVFVDIDPSEEGRTGGPRKSADSVKRQQEMMEDFAALKAEFTSWDHVSLGARALAWKLKFGARLDSVQGDRDLIAVNQRIGRLLIVEVEAESSVQPETKVYKAVGQAVAALSSKLPEGFGLTVGVAVAGARLAGHLKRCSALASLGVFGMKLDDHAVSDEWIFGRPLWL